MGKPRHDYQNERLARPMDTLDTDSILDAPQTFDEEFASYACECEGISGMKYIDTEFDNFVEDTIQSPRRKHRPNEPPYITPSPFRHPVEHIRVAPM